MDVGEKPVTVDVEFGGSVQWSALQDVGRPLLVVDTRLEIRYVNDSASKILGFRESGERRMPRPGFRQYVGSRYPQFLSWLSGDTGNAPCQIVLYGDVIAYYDLYKRSVSSTRACFLIELANPVLFDGAPAGEPLIGSAVSGYSQVPVYIADTDGVIRDANSAFLELADLSEGQLKYYRETIWYDGLVGPPLPAALREQVCAEGCWQGDVCWRTVSGRRLRGKLTVTRAVSGSTALNKECSGLYVHMLEQVENEYQERRPLQSVAELDLNTGMLNRRGFARTFDLVLSEATRIGEPLHVLFVDLDRFPEIDRVHGSAIADKVLTNAALRLKGAVRDSDILARLAPLEFIVVLQGGDPATVAGKLIELLGKPYGIDGLIVESAASVGVASYPDDGLTAKELMVRADCAKYASKRSGGNGYTFYSDCDEQLRVLFSPLGT